jgi:hypothetical protein
MKMQKEINERIEFEGKTRIWIGDPCYVIPDELWDCACKQIYAGTEHEVNHIIHFKYDYLKEAGVSEAMLVSCLSQKLAFIQCGTMYGDGRYYGFGSSTYPVDAGCLAAVPEYLIDPNKIDSANRRGTFFENVDCIALRTDGNGQFIFSTDEKVIEIIETGDDAELP